MAMNPLLPVSFHDILNVPAASDGAALYPFLTACNLHQTAWICVTETENILVLSTFLSPERFFFCSV